MRIDRYDGLFCAGIFSEALGETTDYSAIAVCLQTEPPLPVLYTVPGVAVLVLLVSEDEGARVFFKSLFTSRHEEHTERLASSSALL